MKFIKSLFYNHPNGHSILKYQVWFQITLLIIILSVASFPWVQIPLHIGFVMYAMYVNRRSYLIDCDLED